MHGPAPLTVVLADEPGWRVVQATFLVVATVVAGLGLGASALEFSTHLTAHRGGGAGSSTGRGGWPEAVLVVVLAVGALVVLAGGWWRAVRLLRPEPSWILVWDGRRWSCSVVAGRDVDAPSGALASPAGDAPPAWALEPVSLRISLDLGTWMLLRLERLADDGPASHRMPRVRWRALSRRRAPVAWTPLRAVLWAAQ